MKKVNEIEKGFGSPAFWGFSILLLLIPIQPSLVPAAVLLFILLSFFEIRQFRFDSSFLKRSFLLPGLFLFYVVGLIWTEHMDLGSASIERKLAFFFLPFLFTFLPAFSKAQQRTFPLIFSLGIFINLILSFSQAIPCYSETGARDCFYSSAFSYELHPSYNAMYVLMAMAWLCFEYLFSGPPLKSSAFLLFLFAQLTGIVFIVLLASKAGLLGLVFLFLFLGLSYVFKTGKWKLLIGGVLFLILSFFVLNFISPLPLERFKAAMNNRELSEEELFAQSAASTESNAVRRMIWIVSDEIIAEHPFGVGTGDVYPSLEEKYKEKGMTGALDRSLNAHSQFKQTTIALGWTGLLVLLLVFIYPLVFALKRREGLVVFFLLLVSLNLLVESMFEVQGGVVFFAVLYSFLLKHKLSEEEMNSDKNLE